MQVNKSVLLIIQVLLGTVILAAVLFGGWFLLSLNIDTTEPEVKVQMSRLQSSAATYYARLKYYDGVCSDIGTPGNFRCNAAESAYAIEASLGGGRFYCADSSGFIGERRVSKGDNVSCRDY